MPLTNHNLCDLTETAEYLLSRSDTLIAGWSDRIEASQFIRAREDLETGEGLPGDFLTRMLEAVLTQLKRPEDYTILRRAVREGATEGLTPDAVCRFHLALKGAILDTLRGDLEESIERNEVIDKTGAMLDEMLIRFAQFTHDKRHDEVRALERGQRKVLGFDQDRLQPHLDTMNEGFTSVDNLETITTFNGEMERMTGHSRNEMVGRHVFVLYPPESVSVIRNQLSRRRRGESSTYTTHIDHKDGRLIPVRVSGAPLHDQENRNIGSFAVITDISDQVLAETKLRKNNEEIARLLDRERKRNAYFSIVNQVAQLALSTLEPDQIFDRVVRAVNGHFSYHHTSLFLVEDRELVMHAQSGAYEPYFSTGYKQPWGTGIVGTVVETGQPIVANLAEEDPRRILAFPEEASTGAELCVPIKIGTDVIGALDVQTLEQNIFDESDLSSL